MSLMGSLLAGFVAAALMWPTSDCVRTLVGGRTNPPSCTSTIGLPTHEIAAVVIGLVVAVIVHRALSKRP